MRCSRSVPLICLLLSIISVSRGQIHVLIVDGINNHDWAAATAGIRSILDEAGGFSVDVSTLMPEMLNQWKPNLFRYQVLVNNFNGGHLDNGTRWPQPIEKQMEAYVKSGGGLVVWHAANNAFLHWAAYNDMIGLAGAIPISVRALPSRTTAPS